MMKIIIKMMMGKMKVRVKRVEITMIVDVRLDLLGIFECPFLDIKG